MCGTGNRATYDLLYIDPQILEMAKRRGKNKTKKKHSYGIDWLQKNTIEYLKPE